MNSASFSLCINKVSIFFFSKAQTLKFEFFIYFMSFLFFVFFFFADFGEEKRERERDRESGGSVTLRLFQSPPDVFFLFAGIMIHDHYPSLFFSFFPPLFYEATHYKSFFFLCS